MTSPAAPPVPLGREVTVPQRAFGSRADLFLASRFSSLSRTAAARAIKDGLVTSADRPLKPSTTLREGDVLMVSIPRFAPDGPPPPLPDVLFEDDRVMVISKPSGMLVHPAGDKWAWAVIGLARDARPEWRVDLVHRLDRDTSGVLVLTKDLEANAWLKERFRERSAGLRKGYLAIIRGVPEWDEREIDVPIGDAVDSTVRLRREVRDDGQRAWTTVRVMQRMPHRGLCLVSCHIHTGRTHQIRVHLEHIGCPIVGDRLYGHADDIFLEWLDHGATPRVRAAAGFPRQCLHAWQLTLPHPNGDTIQIEAPLPADMQALVDGGVPVWPLPED